MYSRENAENMLGLALTGFKPWVGLVNHIKTALTADNLTVAMTAF